jgi:hypothetical protein
LNEGDEPRDQVTLAGGRTRVEVIDGIDALAPSSQCARVSKKDKS